MTKSKPTTYSWDFEKEREFMETLVCQRTNFLLVLFGLILAAAVSAKSQLYFQLVLWLGVATIVPVSLTIIGAHWKLDWILKKIYEDENHPITIVSAAGAHRSARWLIGYYIPVFCSVAILTGACLAFFDILRIAQGS